MIAYLLNSDKTHPTLCRMISKYGHLTRSKTSKGILNYIKANNINLTHYWDTPYQLIQKVKYDYAAKKNMSKIERLKRACMGNARIRKNTYARYKRALTLKVGFTGSDYDTATGVLQEAKFLGFEKAHIIMPKDHIIIAVDKYDLSVSSNARNFTITAQYGSPERVKSPHITKWKNGKARTKEFAQDDLYVRSFAQIINPKCINYLIQLPDKKEKTHTYQCNIPENNDVVWDIDQNGLRMVSKSNPDIDYHMRYIDIVQFNYAKIEDQMRSLYHQRQEAQHKIDQQKLSLIDRINQLPVDLYLCIKDSIRAGNCIPGTLAFCTRHMIQKEKHLNAKALLKLLNRNDSPDTLSRVSLVIDSAINRLQQEIKQGFSSLEYHRI